MGSGCRSPMTVNSSRNAVHRLLYFWSRNPDRTPGEKFSFQDQFYY